MRNLRKEKVRTQLQLQKTKYKRQSESLKQYDNAMTNLIKSNFSDKITILQHKQWTEQCQTGVLKLIQEFSKKEKWFKENWMSVYKNEK